ncbi:MAG: GEVED domain-containing protein [Bacteroidota bacterium]
MKKLIYFFLVSNFFSAQAEQPGHLINERLSTCGPIPAGCYPGHVNSCSGFCTGITHVGLGQISKNISDTSGYQDYTCSDSTWLTPGSNYQFSVITGQTYEEGVRAWIDLNNDGNFDTTEIIYSDSAIVYSHSGMITIPSSIVSYTPLRMRVGSDYATYPAANGCTNVQYGHYLDFTIYLDTGFGIHETENNFAVSLAPNPFSSTSILMVDRLKQLNGNAFQLMIFNSQAELVRMQTFTDIQEAIISREGLPNGLYLFELISAKSNIIGAGRFVLE